MWGIMWEEINEKFKDILAFSAMDGGGRATGDPTFSPVQPAVVCQTQTSCIWPTVAGAKPLVSATVGWRNSEDLAGHLMRRFLRAARATADSAGDQGMPQAKK